VFVKGRAEMGRCLWRFFPEREGFDGWHHIRGCGNVNLCRTLAREGVHWTRDEPLRPGTTIVPGARWRTVNDFPPASFHLSRISSGGFR
jgi:hypothetical protein